MVIWFILADCLINTLLVSWLNHLHFYYVVYTAYMSILCLFDSCVFIRQSAKINHITMLLCTILEFLLICYKSVIINKIVTHDHIQQFVFYTHLVINTLIKWSFMNSFLIVPDFKIIFLNIFCVADRVSWKYKITLKKCGNRKFHNIMCSISWQITKIRMIKPAILLSCVLIISLC
jgi:hypothetical protein